MSQSAEDELLPLMILQKIQDMVMNGSARKSVYEEENWR